MKRLIIATGNMGKLNEIKEIMNTDEIEIISM